ncbi:MAG: prolipoprotein diacylglyceryl transferase [Alphaproteobacteria bacterium]|jgi:phosphatidylglycerol:prolipoprotein diacylglycerol transferase|nr:prolipoprotein diacylglyceryl transferase [Alphaproteobacteria bacterium]
MINFPNISPIAFTIASFEIRWYSLAYIFGAILALLYIKFLNKNLNLIPENRKKNFFEDLLFYIILGVLLGGRLGFVIFYGFSYYLSNPLEILYLWQGGMSYHGGLIGVLVASYFLAKKYQMNFLRITDIIVPAVPIGLFLGRIANFVNAELYGKPTTLPWAVHFPNVYLARHPSQLYEAMLEGIVLFVVLAVMWQRKLYNKEGYLSATFIILYGAFRIFIEYFRVGEIYFFDFISMGQVLSLPMIIVGFFILYVARKNQKAD